MAKMFQIWLEDEKGIGFEPTPTPFGPVAIHIFRKAAGHFVDVAARWRDKPPPVTIRIPGFQNKAITNFERPLRLQPEKTAP